MVRKDGWRLGEFAIRPPSYRMTKQILFDKFRYSFVKVSRLGDSEVTFSVFESSYTCNYQFNHSKVKVIPLSDLPKDTTSELAGLSLH